MFRVLSTAVCFSVYILSNLVPEFHEDVQQNKLKLFLQFDKRDEKLAHELHDINS